MSLDTWVHSELRAQLSCDDCGAVFQRAQYGSAPLDYFAGRAEALKAALKPEDYRTQKWQALDGKFFCPSCTRTTCGLNGCTDRVRQSERETHFQAKHPPVRSPGDDE